LLPLTDGRAEFYERLAALFEFDYALQLCRIGKSSTADDRATGKLD
jgi:hypothetical protein